MSLSSVRVRLALGAAVTISIALVISWFGLVGLFERTVERRVGSELNLHLAQIAARTTVTAQGQLSLDVEPADPRFNRVHSGLYWQIEDEATGTLLRSRSLWELRLKMPVDTPTVGALDVHDVTGPRGEMLRAHERRLILRSSSGERVLRFATAIDKSEIDALTDEFAGDARVALLGLGLVLIGASLVQIALGVAPLAGIGRQVAAVRNGLTRRLTGHSADEVRPLVEEVNALLDAVDTQIARARERAADLAHALKTPLSALKSDAERLIQSGEHKIGEDVAAAVATMDAQVERELARIRARTGSTSQGSRFGEISEGVVRVVRRTLAAQTVTIVVEDAHAAYVLIDPADLTEIIGNLVENAVRHARAEVRLAAEEMDGGAVRVVVEDDGLGLDAAQRARATVRGERLDTQTAGTGLGLSIVTDMLAAYGTRLDLAHSPLGGLKASFMAPTRAVSATYRRHHT